MKQVLAGAERLGCGRPERHGTGLCKLLGKLTAGLVPVCDHSDNGKTSGASEGFGSGPEFCA